jgi:hypothetical protein
VYIVGSSSTVTAWIISSSVINRCFLVEAPVSYIKAVDSKNLVLGGCSCLCRELNAINVLICRGFSSYQNRERNCCWQWSYQIEYVQMYSALQLHGISPETFLMTKTQVPNIQLSDFLYFKTQATMFSVGKYLVLL